MRVKNDAKAKAARANRPKVNPLHPTERDKKRYVAFEIISDRPLPFDADKELLSSIDAAFGMFETAKAGIMRVKYDAKLQSGLIRIDRKYVDKLRTCFVMTKQLAGRPVLVRTLRVSGMIHKATAELEARQGKNNVQELTREELTRK